MLLALKHYLTNGRLGGAVWRWGLALACLWCGLGGAAAQEAPTLIREAGVPATAVRFLADPGGRWDIESLRRSVEDTLFEPAPEGVVMGTGQTTYWFKIALQQTIGQGDWVLEMPPGVWRDVEFHGPYRNGRRLAKPQSAGLDHPPAPSLGLGERVFFRFWLYEPGDYVFYVKAKSASGQVYAFSAWDAEAYARWADRITLGNGLAYGVLLALLVYHLGAWLSQRERLDAVFLGLVLAVLGVLASVNGHAVRYLGGMPWLPAQLQVQAPVWGTWAGLAFARGFLDLPCRMPRLNQGLQWVGTGVACLGLLGLVWQPVALWGVVTTVAVVGAGVALGLAVLVWRRGYRPALPFGLGLVVWLWSAARLVPSGAEGWFYLLTEPAAQEVFQWGLVLALLLASLGLSGRRWTLRQASMELQARATQRQQAEESDALTGLLNRAGLVQRLPHRRFGRRRHALLLLNLDNFKAINDRWGYVVGDQVLLELAHRLREPLRPQDLLARLGRDEFVVVMTDVDSRERIDTLAAELLACVRRPMVPVDAALTVQASVAVVCSPRQGRSLPELLKAADRVMTRLKDQAPGRHAFHEDLFQSSLA